MPGPDSTPGPDRTAPGPDAAPGPDDAAAQPPGDTRGGGGVLFGFLPWIVFYVAAGPGTWKFAALAALVVSLALNLPWTRRGSVKALDVAGMAFFATLCVLALVLGRGGLAWLGTYAVAVSSAVIAVVALGSLAVVPFTEQYAREATPPRVWHTPVFKRTNRLLTAMWGLVFAITAVLGVIAVHDSGTSLWLEWVVPIALLVVAFRVTRWYPAHVRARYRDRGVSTRA